MFSMGTSGVAVGTIVGGLFGMMARYLFRCQDLGTDRVWQLVTFRIRSW